MFTRLLGLLGYAEKQVESLAEVEDKLLSAAAHGDSHSLVALMKTEVCINCQDSQGSTPLHLAVKGHRVTCVELILQHPQIQIKKDRWGRTPLHAAVIWQTRRSCYSNDGHIETSLAKPNSLELILEHNQNAIDIADTDGRTALHIACAAANLDLIQTLLEYKANVNALDQRKWTPLMGAIAIGSYEVTELLLNHGANIDEPLKFNSGLSALRLAICRHNYNLTKLLIQRGAMVEFTATITQGNLGQNTPRQILISSNLATTAIEKITLAKPRSIDIAMLVIQAAPSPPDEDTVIKMYEQLVKPSRRFQRSLSRDLQQLLENISEATLHKIMRLIMISLAVGVDLSKSNIDRLSRKFRLDARQDVKLFALIRALRDKNLYLLTIQTMRKQLGAAGHCNIIAALNKSDAPKFVKDLLLLRGNI